MLRRLVFAVFMAMTFFSVWAGQIDINTADAASLASLRGIGPHKAAAIVAYRKKFGAFRTVDDLAKVKGIGKRTIDINRERIAVQTGVPSP